MSSPTKRLPILLVLDINGTLLERLTKSEQRILAKANPQLPPSCHFHLSRAQGYLRPYLDTFLSHVFRHFHVAAWTSATPKNAFPMFDYVFGSAYAPHLTFAWTRDQCCQIGGRANGFEAKKDLRRVWTNQEFNSLQQFTQKNTILLDDSIGKATLNPLNALHLRTYTVTDPSFPCQDDPTLLSIIKYLSALADSQPGDIRDYLATHPAFTFDSTGVAEVEEPWRVDVRTEFRGIPKNRPYTGLQLGEPSPQQQPARSPRAPISPQEALRRKEQAMARKQPKSPVKKVKKGSSRSAPASAS
ncbi:NLI interacting factor-like phosphatase-domain-containing protein [Phlyctochytrium arcticum]|nr:NLI interacting factor-like phosphatase-domain-containing protein [Phlyctochytrium arcticum]